MNKPSRNMFFAKGARHISLLSYKFYNAESGMQNNYNAALMWEKNDKEKLNKNLSFETNYSKPLIEQHK